MIIGRDGYSSAIPAFIGDFQAEESSSCGGVSLTGRISLDTYRKNPLAYTAGGEWYAFRAETLGMDAWGELTEPAIRGGVVELTARGPAHQAEREIHNRLYQERGYERSVTADSDPHEYPANKHIEVEVGKGKIKWRPEKDHAFSDDDETGVVLDWEMGDRISRDAFKIRKTENDAGWEFVLRGANTEDNGVGGSLPTVIQTYLLDATNPDGTPIDEDWSKDYDLLYLGLRKVGAGTPTDPPRFWITKHRVNGVASDDDFTASDLVRDLCGLLGWDDSEVQENSYPILPFRIERQTARDVFDYISLVTGWRVVARRVGRRVVCDFGPWDTRVWTLVDPSAPRNYVPVERFNRATVVYRWAGGNATGIAKAIADPNPLPGVVLDAPSVELSGRLPSEEQAEDIAQRLADFYASPRFSGDFQAAWVLDQQGLEHPAQDIRAGDIVIDGGVKLKVDTVSRSTGPVVRCGLLTDLPFVERLDARRARRLARLVS